MSTKPAPKAAKATKTVKAATPRKKYLQRPQTVEVQHLLLRNVPKSLVRRGVKKAREGRPPTTLTWALIILLERWVEGVNISSEAAKQPPASVQLGERPMEQSF